MVLPKGLLVQATLVTRSLRQARTHGVMLCVCAYEWVCACFFAAAGGNGRRGIVLLLARTMRPSPSQTVRDDGADEAGPHHAGIFSVKDFSHEEASCQLVHIT